MAAEASQKATEARSEIAKGAAEGTSTNSATSVSDSDLVADADDSDQQDIDTNSTKGADVNTILDAQSTLANASSEQAVEASGADFMQARIGRIQNAYLQAYTPSREGLSFQA